MTTSLLSFSSLLEEEPADAEERGLVVEGVDGERREQSQLLEGQPQIHEGRRIS